MSRRLSIKILLTARDPATALAFKVLLPELVSDPLFDVRVCAQAPADQILQVKNFVVTWPARESLSDQVAKLEAICNSFKPDVVLTGISGPDSGVDEAALIWAQNEGLPSYALQSYWGDINQAVDTLPGTVFVLDEAAVRLTKKRYPDLRCVPVGSLKHANTKPVDVFTIRDQLRPSLVKSNEVLIGFYGQPLEEQLGYLVTLETMARKLSYWSRPFKLMYRAHPKESRAFQARSLALLQSFLGNRVFEDPQNDLDSSLGICDLVVSVYSTCGYDNLYLNQPLKYLYNASVFLWFESELQQWFYRYSGLRSLPLVEEGVVLCVEHEDELLPVFDLGLSQEVKKCLKRKIDQYLPPPGDSIEKLIATIKDDLR